MTLNNIENIPVVDSPAGHSVISIAEKHSPFKDNMEHLEALELSAKIRLAISYLRYTDPSARKNNNNDPSSGKRRKAYFAENFDLSFLDIPRDKITIEKLERLLERVEGDTGQRVRASLKAGVRLNFEEFCASNQLDDIERIIMTLMFFNNTSKSFRMLFESCEFDFDVIHDGSMCIGTILFIIHNDYREQISGRRYFSIEANLIKQQIVIPYYKYENVTNIIDMPIRLHERIVRFIIGDNNTYDTDLQGFSRERGNIRLD